MQFYLQRLCVKVQRLNVMRLLLVLVHIVDGCRVTLKSQIVIIIQSHLFIMVLAVQVYEGFDYLHLHIGRGKSIIVLLFHVDGELMAEATHRHGTDIRVRDFTFYPIKNRKERPIGQDVVQVLIGQK